MTRDPVHFVADDLIVAYRSALDQRLKVLAEEMPGDVSGKLLDAPMRLVLQDAFAKVHADEGTVWLTDAAGENLIPVYNSGPSAKRIVGKFKQPLASGLISMVFATERPFAENGIGSDARHSKLLDEKLKLSTQAMIAVPLYYLRGCRGVVSCVQIAKPGSRARARGFTPEDMDAIQHAGQVLGRLIEQRAVAYALEWSRA